MPNVGSAFRGTAGGAGAGFAIGGPAGAAIGGGLGLLTSLFEESPEEQRRRQIREYRENLARLKSRTISEGMGLFNRQTQRNLATAGGLAARRALASGKTGEVESYVLPATGEVARESSQGARQFLTDVNREYDRLVATAELGVLNEPLSPQFSDYLLEGGSAAMNYKLDRDLIKSMESEGLEGFDYPAIHKKKPWEYEVKPWENPSPLPQ